MKKVVKTKEIIETNSKGNKRGLSESSKSNLKVGGPGRPKGKLNYDTRVDMAIEVLAQKYVDEQNTKNKGKKGYTPITVDDVDIEGDIFAQHINKARNGDRHFIDSYLDRRHGKAKQPVELSGSVNNTIEYNLQLKEAEDRLRKFQSKWFKPVKK